MSHAPLPKLLITGASGFLGWNLCQVAAQDWDVYGVYRSHSHPIPNTTLLKADLTNPQEFQTLFQTIRPDAVVNLAAESKPNRCQDNPDKSHQINVIVARDIAKLCADTDIPYVFTSTDLVFDGLKPPYRENDALSPVNLYGEQKALAESEILKCYPKATICRMPLMFGAAPPTASSFLQPFIQTLRDGRELKLFTDEVRTPVSGITAAKGLLLALHNVQGHIHLGGKERISRFEFGRLMVEIFNLPAAGLKPARQQDVKMSASRPPDVSLDSTKAFSMGYTPGSVREELKALQTLWSTTTK
ncbi:MAG: NAD(P)-dependent oxidoreductase [Leptolyngbyaceae cyanobacterium MAG.088]|nr:NAD(P)-dependent oxidoreductase [Leptolyngbyaceae cyanobacterium MAG.088]